MSGRTWFSGMERWSIEIAGHLDPSRARALAPQGVAVREDPDGAEIEMLVFRMSGLAPNGLPWIGTDYGEVLFRLGVEWNGERAWFVTCCALDRAGVAAAAATLMRYPVRRVDRIHIDASPIQWRFSASERGGELLRGVLVPKEELSPEARSVRPVLVRAGNKLFRVPWGEVPAPQRWRAEATIEPGALEKEALGECVRWKSAVLHEGRLHRCGVAGEP